MTNCAATERNGNDRSSDSAVCRGRGCVQRVGAMLTMFFNQGPVRSWSDAQKSDTARFGRWHSGMIARGQYFPPSQYEALFVSAAHTDADIDATVQAAEEALREASA